MSLQSTINNLQQRVSRLEAQAGGGEQLSPNPPIIPAIEANVAMIRSILNVAQLGVDVPELGGTIASAQAALGLFNQSPARAFTANAATSPAGTYPMWVQVPLDTIDYDPSSSFSSVGIGLAYTAPTTGIYAIAASAQVEERGSIQPQWILSLNVGLTEMSRGIATQDFTSSTGVNMTGNLGLVVADIRRLTATDVIYPAIYAPYQFTYETSVGAVSNSLAISRIA